MIMTMDHFLFYQNFCCMVCYILIMVHAQICMDHILVVLRIPEERASGFVALGEMAGALDGELIHYLPTITTHLHDAVSLSL